MKIGIFGGSFNPPHVGHLTIAHEAMLQHKLDKVVFVPAGNPYMKNQKEMATYEERLDMVSHAIANGPFCYSTIERDDSCSYTCDTLKKMKEYHKDDKLYLIIGGDSLIDMKSWKNPEEIFKLATVLVANRQYEDIVSAAMDYQNKYRADIRFIYDVDIKISSSYIRDRIRNHGSYRYLVPASVADYIRRNNLYTEKIDELHDF